MVERNEEVLSSQLNPYAEPYEPVGVLQAAAVHVEPNAPEDSVVPDVVEDQSVRVEQEVVTDGSGNISQSLWSPEGHQSAAQKRDPDVGFIYHLIESGVSKPTWNEIVRQSRDVKTLWNFWQRLAIREGILQQTEYWQFDSSAQEITRRVCKTYSCWSGIVATLAKGRPQPRYSCVLTGLSGPLMLLHA